jgi:choline dehydrogenase-like flavoprotein
MDARRLATLRTIAATFAPQDARLDRVMYWAERAIDSLTPGRRAEFGQLLDLLALPMLLGDSARAKILRSFADSPVAKLRTGFATLKRLLLFLAYAESEPGSNNPTWARIGYPGPRSDRGADDAPLPYAVARAGETVAAEVVVIGSGAGGGVAAASFARAGKKVVVLEAGLAFDARTMNQREIGMSDLYLDGGLTASDDLGVAILAGSTVGGGTTVNWCTSFRMPERIATEWAMEANVASLPDELAPHYAHLERELGLAPLAEHNANNRVIIDGANALGVHSGAMPRNAPDDCGEGCGYCGFGCAYGKKRSTPRAFLPDVAKNGGAIYAGAFVRAIEIEGTRAKRVTVDQTAVPGEVRRFSVSADLIVVAAGTLRSPGILARSGIANPVLGRRLFLHPVSAVFTEFEHDIVPFQGPMQSAYSDAYNYRSGNYGTKIEVAPTHPGVAAIAMPWQSREQHAGGMDRSRRSASLIAVTRDRDPGSIDLDDEAQIRYRVSPFDAEHLLAGIVGMADIAFAAGAMRIATLHNAPITIERSEWNAARRAAFEAEIAKIGSASNRQIFFSAHQMGTCALGSDPHRSVVDPSGKVWGYDNIIVADGSIFPMASGVNPMLTIMAMASRVSALNGGSLDAPAPTVEAVAAEIVETAVGETAPA